MDLTQIDAAALRVLQAPVRETYKTDPTVARTPLRARGTYLDPGLTATVDGSERYCVVGQSLREPTRFEIRRG